MSLLDQAKKVAEDKQREVAEQKVRDAAEHVEDEAHLVKLKKALFVELNKLHKQETKGHGHFILEKLDRTGIFGEVAFLYAGEKKETAEIVAWFKVHVVRGTWSPSDDCRNEPFKALDVSARVYPPDVRFNHNHDRTWDLQETRYYGNGGRQVSCSSLDGMPKFFKELAEVLAVWL